MTVTTHRVALWDFGLSQRDVPTSAVVSVPRSALMSVRNSGRRDAFGVDTRFRFVDGSFVDLKVMEHPRMADFWSTVI